VAAEQAPVLGDPDGELEPDALVPRQQRKKPVGGGGAEDLDSSPRFLLPEGADEVAPRGAEEIAHPGEAIAPEAHQREEPRLLGGEIGRRLVAGFEALGQEGFQLLHEDGAGELVREDRREADGHRRGDPLLLERLERLEQREVGVERGFAQPVASVGPPPVVQHPRQMAVQHEDEVHLGSGQARGPRATTRR
jgi:hypothetical protein